MEMVVKIDMSKDSFAEQMAYMHQALHAQLEVLKHNCFGMQHGLDKAPYHEFYSDSGQMCFNADSCIWISSMTPYKYYCSYCN